MQDVEKIAEGLTEAQRDALIQLADKPDKYGFLQAENDDEVHLIHGMTTLGLVAKIQAGGFVFMEMRPLGQAVRNHLKGNTNDQ